MITIIDLGIGNANSVGKALTALGVGNCISSEIAEIRNGAKLILPGVGNFGEASQRLKTKGIRKVIREEALGEGKPLLGICLGMQLLAEASEESDVSGGLGVLSANVVKMLPEDERLRVPHVGWDDVSTNGMKLFSGIEDGACFYFAHSYRVVPHERIECATCTYGIEFVAAVRWKNIMGVQFHPEKSQQAGLHLLRNFVEGIY
jgi:imidazole glycerol-phosphate synthase subunit HisH